MGSLKDKKILITGGSRGIGLAIALRAARDGAKVAICAKTVEAHPKLPGTIFEAAKAIEAAGGTALPVQMDVREEEQVHAAVKKTAEAFGGIDILINNASAIFLAGTTETPMKRFDLMHQVNTRGTFLMSQACLPYLHKSDNPHIVMLSPPLNIAPRWFGPHLAYSLAKYGMSLCVLGLAEEQKEKGVAVNALWPCTVIDTAAMQMLGGAVKPENCRKPDIVADAVHAIVSAPSATRTGQFLLDEDVLRAAGVTDFAPYAVTAGGPLLKDLFLD